MEGAVENLGGIGGGLEALKQQETGAPFKLEAIGR